MTLPLTSAGVRNPSIEAVLLVELPGTLRGWGTAGRACRDPSRLGVFDKRNRRRGPLISVSLDLDKLHQRAGESISVSLDLDKLDQRAGESISVSLVLDKLDQRGSSATAINPRG